MSSLRRTRLALHLAVSGLGLLACGTAPALADTPAPQTADSAKAAAPAPEGPAADVIVVTGSRLSTKIPDQPITTFKAQAIASQGYTNIGQALTDLPMFGIPSNSPVASQGSFGAGQTFINLYNLGSQRTLTLINGNRFVSGATSSIFGASVGSPVDLGEIAPGLLDHIDVVSVGGAPIYGSDAIAGTVNVVLRKDYEGLELTGSQGISARGDAKDYNFSLLAGKNFAGGRGNITLNVYYDNQDGLTTGDRYVTGADAPFFGATTKSNGPQNVAYGQGERWGVVTATGIPSAIDNIPFPNGQTGGAADPIFGAPFQSITNAAGQSLYFNTQGKLVPFVHGHYTGDNQNEAGGDGFATGNYGNLITRSHRIQGTLLTNFEVSDHVRVHGEAWLGRNVSSNVAEQPLYNTALFSGPGGAGLPYGNYALSSSNPFLSAADQATIQASLANAGLPTDTFYLARANIDLYDGSFRTQSDLARFVGGVDGDFALGTHKFRWEATINYGQTKTVTQQPGLVWQNILNALDAVTDDQGNITCRAGYTNADITTRSSTCAPLNIFGLGRASQAALNYITADAASHQTNKQLDAVVDIKGDIVHLPGGDVSAVLGGEIRRESQAFDPGTYFAGSFSQYAAIAPVAGSYHTHEAFGELTIPLIGPSMNVPLINSANLHGAARYTDNSINGGFWSYTAGGDISPIPGLTFRGNYTRSFRQPAVTEAFAPVATTFEYGNDPCDSRFLSGGSNPSVRQANCAKDGIPTNFVSTIVGATIQGSGGGSASLTNEVARSWTVGGTFRPTFVRGLSLTADYVHINIDNEILQPGIEAEMQACYDSPSFPNSPFCKTFTRDKVTHQITDFTDNFINIGTQSFRAIQANLSYTLPLSRVGLNEDAGTFSVSLDYLHEIRNDYVVGTGSVQYNLRKVGESPDSVTTNLVWAGKKLDWSWTIIYDSPTVVNPNSPASEYQYYRVGAYWMINTSIGLKVNKNLTFRAIANNVFNMGVTYAGIVPEFSTNKEFNAVLGRSYRLSATIKL